jgi:hypothetical protein
VPESVGAGTHSVCAAPGLAAVPEDGVVVPEDDDGAEVLRTRKPDWGPFGAAAAAASMAAARRCGRLVPLRQLAYNT